MNLQICGQIPDFNKKISTVRSRGVSLIPILQNMGQFQNRYPNGLSDEIIGNTDTRISMGLTDVLSASYFCNLIGIASVETTSIRKENSVEGNLNYGQKTVSTQKRNLLNVDEILRLPTMKLIVNLRGNKPILLDKVIYTEHFLSKKLKDSPITDYKPEWLKNVIQEKLPSKEELKSKKNVEKLGWHNF